MTDPVVAPDQDFNALFDEAAAAAETGATLTAAPPVEPAAPETPPVAPPAAPETPPAAVVAPPAVPETPPAAPETPPVTPPAAPETPPATPPVTPPAPAAPELPPAAPTPPPETPEQKAQREEFERSITPYEMTAEEKAAFELVKRDYPEQALAIEALFRQREREYNARVYNTARAVTQYVREQVAPLAVMVEGYNADTKERHLEAIKQQHSDYDQIKPLLKPWIDSLGPLDRPGAELVYNEGRTSDVVALVTRFKTATGRAAPSAPGPVVVTPPAAPVHKTVAGGDDLLPVNSKRTAPAPRGGVDKNDFYGAWEEAAAL